MSGFTVAIGMNVFPPSDDLSILKPDSLTSLSDQFKTILLAEAAAAVRFEGGAGRRIGGATMCMILASDGTPWLFKRNSM